MGVRNGRRRRAVSPARIWASLRQMPPPDLYSRPLLHIDCRGAVQIDNCKGILLYNETAVEFAMGSTRVRLTGDALRLETVAKEIVLVRGRIFRVDFLFEDAPDRDRVPALRAGRE